MRAQLCKIIIEYTLSVHATAIAGNTRRNFMLGAIETVHFMSGIFSSFNELSSQVIGIPVTAWTPCQYYNLHFIICFIVKQFSRAGQT